MIRQPAALTVRLTPYALRFTLILLALAGCVSEEDLKRANGFYQEGISYVETDRQQAFVSFQKAVQINPRHKEAHYYLGHLYFLQAKYKQAEEQFLEVLRIDQDYSDAHNYLGRVLEQQGRWDEAIRSYRQALTNPLFVTPDKALFNLGRALMHEGDAQGAIQAFEDALLVSPPSVPPELVNLELGKAYSKLGDDAKAREALTRVTSLNKGGTLAAEAGRLLERLKR